MSLSVAGVVPGTVYRHRPDRGHWTGKGDIAVVAAIEPVQRDTTAHHINHTSIRIRGIHVLQ